MISDDEFETFMRRIGAPDERGIAVLELERHIRRHMAQDPLWFTVIGPDHQETPVVTLKNYCDCTERLQAEADREHMRRRRAVTTARRYRAEMRVLRAQGRYYRALWQETKRTLHVVLLVVMALAAAYTLAGLSR